MTKKCLYAHTVPGSAPAFVNVSREDDTFTVIVRSQGDAETGVTGSQASIELSLVEATDLYSSLYRSLSGE